MKFEKWQRKSCVELLENTDLKLGCNVKSYEIKGFATWPY